MAMSVSCKKGTKTTNIEHNNRTEKEASLNIDESRSYKNKYLIQENLKDLYEREFGDALEKYNAKQKRSERKIKSYYDHVKASKKVAVQQEMIIQIGDKDDFISDPGKEEVVNEILEKWFEDFQERNSNLKIYNAVIHNDEASPHLHINFVPVAEVTKRGLEKQVAFDRAIVQQDKELWMEYDELQERKRVHRKEQKGLKKKDQVPYPFEEWEAEIDRPFAKWRENEVGYLEQMLNERGIERKMVGTNEYEDTIDYKEKKDLERELGQLEIEYQEAKIKTAAELERFKRTHKLNKEIEEPGQKEGPKPIIVPVGYVSMPEVDVQLKKGFRGDRYEVNLEQVEELKRWAINQKEEKERFKEKLEEKDKRVDQLIRVMRTRDVEVKQLVDVAIASERAQVDQERQNDRGYILRLEDGLQDAERRVGALQEENTALTRWKERALAVMDRLGVKERFENAMKRFGRNRDEGIEH